MRDELPRERVWDGGVGRITDRELISLVVGAASPRIADELLQQSGGMAELARASLHELVRAGGVGNARAAQLAAAFELGRRAIIAATPRPVVLRDADAVFARMQPRFAGLSQEVFWVLALDARNGLVDEFEVARGNLTSVEVHPREVFRPLIRIAAAACVLVHNHPSGDSTPSPEDLVLTSRLRGVGELVGIPVVDHVIVAGNGHRSIAEWMGTSF